jgi:hypothetical protein
MMGGGTFSAKAYSAFTASTVGKSTDEIYTNRSINALLNPKGVKVRESRDSVDNPHSTPLIVGIDVTGSMGMLADVIARQGLGTLFTSVLERKPISDPHVMFMGIGDANCDEAPLQVSQFEADNRIVEQLTQIYIEQGGGGNDFESYNLPWYFAAYHTVHDSYEKRGKRGYLFTIGDEEAPHPLTKHQLKHIIGDDVERELTTKELLVLAQRTYDVYHVIIEEGSHARSHLSKVQSSWRELLGQKVITLADHTKLAETISSAIEVAEGVEVEDAVGHWGGHTTGIVHAAIRNLPKSNTPKLLGHT